MPDRNETIKIIRQSLKERSGKAWSVTGDRGTAWGWIKIDAPPRRRTWKHVQTKTPEPPAPNAIYLGAGGVTPRRHITDGTIVDYQSDPWARQAVESGQSLVFDWEVEDPTAEYGHMSRDDRKELAVLLGLNNTLITEVHLQGVSIPASSEYYEEYIARAKGETPTVYGTQYWD